MPDLQDLAYMASLTGGLQEGQNTREKKRMDIERGLSDIQQKKNTHFINLQNLRLAESKAARDKQIFDLDKKIKTADLEKKELAGDIDRSTAQIAKFQLDEMFKKMKKRQEVGDEVMKSTEEEQLGAIKNLNEAEDGLSSMAVSLMEQPEVSYEYNLGPVKVKGGNKKTDKMKESNKKALGVLRAGGKYAKDDYGEYGVRKFKNREEAEVFAASELGDSYDTDFPEALEYIEKRFPKGEDQTQEQQNSETPKSVKPLSLMQRAGKSIKEAVLPSEKVLIVTKDGQRGYIPKANLQEAIKRGAKLAN